MMIDYPPEELMWFCFEKGSQRFYPESAKESAEIMMQAVKQKFGISLVDSGKKKGIGTDEFEIAKIRCAIDLCALILDPKYEYIFNESEEKNERTD